MNTGTRIIFLLYFVLGWSAIAEAVDLPIIEMPKYVITGVEQATALSGKKIPPESSARFLIPELIPENRPTISLDILETPAEIPVLLKPIGGVFTEAEALLGAFGKVSGHISTASESDLSGYSAGTGIDRYPMRTSVGPKFHGFVKGSGVRWIGQETTIASQIDANYSTFVRRGLLEDETNRMFSLGLQAGITPIRLRDGRLNGHFQYDMNLLDNHRNITQSHDRLHLAYSQPIQQGWLDAKLDLEVEAVSADKASHSLYSLETLYCRQTDSRLLWRLGLIGYTGQVVTHQAINSVNLSENRSGAGLLAGVTWQVSNRSTIVFDLLPRPRFEDFGSLFANMMALDSTTRGVTVESPTAIGVRYINRLTATTRLRVSTAFSEERHRPFWVVTPTKNWRITTRKTKMATSKVELELEPLPQIGVTLSGSLTNASSSGDQPGSNAPFITPGELGCDAIYQYGKVMVENNLSWKKGTKVDFNTDFRSPDRVDWNVSLHWTLRQGLIGRAGIDNLLNRNQWQFPDYALPPLTFWIGVDWRSGDPIR